MHFLIYSVAGQCLKSWGETRALADLTLTGDDKIVEGEYTDLTHCVLGSELLAYTAAQIHARAQKPSVYATWSNLAMAWVDPRSLAEIKTERTAAIKLTRDKRKLGGYRAGGRWFQSDPVSFAQYGIMLTTVLEKSLPATYALSNWRDLAGVRGPLTVGVLREIRDAGLMQERALFDAAEVHIAAMSSSADPLSYTWLTGWPATFAESLS